MGRPALCAAKPNSVWSGSCCKPNLAPGLHGTTADPLQKYPRNTSPEYRLKNTLYAQVLKSSCVVTAHFVPFHNSYHFTKSCTCRNVKSSSELCKDLVYLFWFPLCPTQ